MTRFAAMPVLQGGLEMGRGLEVLFVQILVTRLANVRPDVLRLFVVVRCSVLSLTACTGWSRQEQQQHRSYHWSQNSFVEFADNHSGARRFVLLPVSPFNVMTGVRDCR
jgi:hypothetical protein